MFHRAYFLALLVGLAGLLPGCAEDAERVRLATTTSTRDSGLLEVLLPPFEERTGVAVDVIAVGTGAAFRMARDGNADLLVVHDRAGEDAFIAEGHGAERRDLMWNTFEILGPPGDPAGVARAASGPDALLRIARHGAPFVSRGDDSGTHRREMRLWGRAGGPPAWEGYRSSGQGMGATLRIADELAAYVLTDRGTRLNYAGDLALAPLLADLPELRNPYGVVLMDPRRHPEVEHAAAAQLADWLTSAEAAAIISGYRVNGAQLFHPLRGER